MDQVEVDIKQRLAAGGVLVDHVLIPDLVVERLGHGFLSSLQGLRGAADESLGALTPSDGAARAQRTALAGASGR